MKMEVSVELVELAKKYKDAGEEVKKMREQCSFHQDEAERLTEEIRNKRDACDVLRREYWDKAQDALFALADQMTDGNKQAEGQPEGQPEGQLKASYWGKDRR